MRRPTRLLASIAAFAAAAGSMMIFGAAPAQAVTNGGGLWKIDCSYSHTAADDPIVYPGQPGASHLHDFYGNASTNAYSTYSSMDGVKSTCVHNDRAAYWTPTLYRNGQLVHSDGLVIYYDVKAYKAQKVEAFPKNFMMIEGNKNATTSAQQSTHVYWGCEDDSRISYTRREPPDSCSPSNGIMLRVEFPSCWDGVTVAGNEIDHLAFPSGGNCPKGFPHVFPHISFHATYQFHNASTGKITFSSGNVYSAHVDFWNTWDQSTLQTLVNNCSNGGSKYGPNCGHFTGRDKGSPGKPVPAVNTSTHNPLPGGTSTTAVTTEPTASPTVKPTSPATTPPATTGGKGTSPAPCVTGVSRNKVALTSNDTALNRSGSLWGSPLVSTAAAVAVGLIILFEGGVLVRRTRRRYARR
jgi:Domain of unknown function (DUF1996)